VASPRATGELRDKPLDATFQAGIDYVVLVTLRSLGSRVLVHVKLVDRTGFVRWTADRALSLDQLQREQLAMSGELSRQMLGAILGSGLISSPN
jgi:chromosome condensin MukBEF ATPase and DNA-binding subunit MukB